MLRFLIMLLVVEIALGFNIEPNDPALLQPQTRKGINQKNFFGYEIRYGFGSDDALK